MILGCSGPIYDQSKITLNWEKKYHFITSDKYSLDHNYVFLIFLCCFSLGFFNISILIKL